MNFSKNISNELTELITNELDYNEDKKEIIAYAVETTILLVLGFFIVILLGYFLNALMSTVIAAIFGGSLRKLSGGAHFDSAVKCLAFGSIVYSLIGVSAKKLVYYGLTNQYVLIFSLLVSLLLVTFLAPVDSESKPIHSSRLKLKLRISSMVFVIISLVLVSFVDNNLVTVSVVLGIVYQSFTLLPFFNKKGGEC